MPYSDFPLGRKTPTTAFWREQVADMETTTSVDATAHPPARAPRRPSTVVQGTCDLRFERIREEFERNFAERGELGASVCVYVDGEPVVDLWGGIADPSTGRAWDRDTMHVIMSATKGASALCAHMLIDRGQLDLDTPIARYWPEFCRHGKDSITVRQVLNHQSGVCHVSPLVAEGGFFDWELMMRLTEDSEPFWDEIAQPLDLDFWIGLPEQHEARVAPSQAWDLDGGDPCYHPSRPRSPTRPRCSRG